MPLVSVYSLKQASAKTGACFMLFIKISKESSVKNHLLIGQAVSDIFTAILC